VAVSDQIDERIRGRWALYRPGQLPKRYAPAPSIKEGLVGVGPRTRSDDPQW